VPVRVLVLAWFPVALWALLIYVLSDQPHLHATTGIVELVLRKSAHVVVYAVLTLLLVRALASSGVRRTTLPAAALAVAYAASDEYHQTFVAGRQGTPRDVAIDAVGVALALLAVPLAWPGLQRRLAAARSSAPS
jgi:hypothetical protein